jgi:hypothetical protein
MATLKEATENARVARIKHATAIKRLHEAEYDLVRAERDAGGESLKQKKKRERQDEDWNCAGNVIDGTPCAGGAKSNQRAPDTRGEDGKLHQTCKECKKLIKKAKKADK